MSYLGPDNMELPKAKKPSYGLVPSTPPAEFEGLAGERIPYIDTEGRKYDLFYWDGTVAPPKKGEYYASWHPKDHRWVAVESKISFEAPKPIVLSVGRLSDEEKARIDKHQPLAAEIPSCSTATGHCGCI